MVTSTWNPIELFTVNSYYYLTNRLEIRFRKTNKISIWIKFWWFFHKISELSIQFHKLDKLLWTTEKNPNNNIKYDWTVKVHAFKTIFTSIIECFHTFYHKFSIISICIVELYIWLIYLIVYQNWFCLFMFPGQIRLTQMLPYMPDTHKHTITYI